MTDIGSGNGRRVQLRAVRSDGWTKARRTTFLSVLAATCNSAAAARAAGETDHSALQWLKRDGEFSQLWDEALEAGYERLENELLARALGQASSGDNPGDGEIEAASATDQAFDPDLAMRVLKLRADQGRGAGAGKGRAGVPRMTQGEIDAALLARLDALAARRRA